jgi:protein phosphatase
LLSVFGLVGALVVAGVVAYQWTQTRYFVGVSNDVVSLYRGVPEDVWVFSLSSV